MKFASYIAIAVVALWSLMTLMQLWFTPFSADLYLKLTVTLVQDCPVCSGKGVVKSDESMAIEVVRLLQLAKYDDRIAKVTIRVAEDVAAYLNNRKRRELASIEEDGSMVVLILGSESLSPEYLKFTYSDSEGNTVLAPTA